MSGGWKVRITMKIGGDGCLSERLFHAAFANRVEAEDAVRAYDEIAPSDALVEALTPLTAAELLQRRLNPGQISQWEMTKFSKVRSNPGEARDHKPA